MNTQNHPDGITVYATSWCSDCRRSKRFLESHGISYTYIDIESDPEATKLVLELNNGKQSVPTIVFPDGSVLVEPTDPALAQKLGIPL